MVVPFLQYRIGKVVRSKPGITSSFGVIHHRTEDVEMKMTVGRNFIKYTGNREGWDIIVFGEFDLFADRAFFTKISLRQFFGNNKREGALQSGFRIPLHQWYSKYIEEIRVNIYQ